MFHNLASQTGLHVRWCSCYLACLAIAKGKMCSNRRLKFTGKVCDTLQTCCLLKLLLVCHNASCLLSKCTLWPQTETCFLRWQPTGGISMQSISSQVSMHVLAQLSANASRKTVGQQACSIDVDYSTTSALPIKTSYAVSFCTCMEL